MRFSNASGCVAGWTSGFERDGRELLVVIVKCTYRLPENGADACLAQIQLALVQADEFSGEPGLTAPIRETDYAQRKPGCDVLLVGSAHAPPGTQVTRLAVGLQVGTLQKSFMVVGPRIWRKRIGTLAASEPAHFTTLPLSYDCAFGGTDPGDAADGADAASGSQTYLANPVGRGFWPRSGRAEGQPLPHTEQIGVPVEKPGGSYLPMAFSPIGRHWAPRAAYAGTYDKRWQEELAPLWPADFDYRYFQGAPPDQVISYPRGGEAVALHHLTPDGLRRFRLPQRAMPVTFIPHRGRDLTQQAVLDTIVFEPDAERFALTWRSTLALGRSLFDVREVIAGEMSKAWHRSRRFPGKTYYPGLADVVARRRATGAL